MTMSLTLHHHLQLRTMRLRCYQGRILWSTPKRFNRRHHYREGLLGEWLYRDMRARNDRAAPCRSRQLLCTARWHSVRPYRQQSLAILPCTRRHAHGISAVCRCPPVDMRGRRGPFLVDLRVFCHGQGYASAKAATACFCGVPWSIYPALKPNYEFQRLFSPRFPVSVHVATPCIY